MNVPLAVMALLNLDPVLDIIFIGPAATISAVTILALVSVYIGLC